MRIVALLLLLAALPVHARTRVVRVPKAEQILCMLAHPDDEGLVAPILGKKCVDEHAYCTVLTLSRGENSVCTLAPDDCRNLGSVRASELVVAGAVLHFTPIQWSFPDVFTPETSWPSNAADEIASVIAAKHPDVIYTFDPNHGSSCHQAHRYTGELVLRVARGINVQLIDGNFVGSANPIRERHSGSDDIRRAALLVVDDC